MISFRSQFPVAARWAFLDHAAVAPLPAPAVAALREYADSLAENGIAAVQDWLDRIADVRGLAARLINAPDADDVYFVPNTTHGIGVVAEGFPWQAGRQRRARGRGVPGEPVPVDEPRRAAASKCGRVPSRGEPRVASTTSAPRWTRRTRVLAVSAVEFASGFRNDLDALGELCRERGVFFFVDAIQALGVFPLDVQRTPIDALSADGHKWLLGPEGAGIGYIRREWVERLHPIGVGANSVVQPLRVHAPSTSR